MSGFRALLTLVLITRLVLHSKNVRSAIGLKMDLVDRTRQSLQCLSNLAPSMILILRCVLDHGLASILPSNLLPLKS